MTWENYKVISKNVPQPQDFFPYLSRGPQGDEEFLLFPQLYVEGA